ncbi:MAG: RluA family pseudouridine synthase [Cyclobacteriaceae bacterium]
MNLPVIYEDNHLLVINKPAGLLVQGDQTGDVPLVELGKQYLKEKYQKPGAVFLGVVHRLDRPVSGIVLMARTSKALGRMNQLFSNHEIEKVYLALVGQRPQLEEGELVQWLKKDHKKNKTKAFKKEIPGSKKAILSYKLLKGDSKPYWLEIYPKTGRPHQIRVQLASLGCPIVGDLKYGYPTPNKDKSICLHASKLTFVHPVKKETIVLQASSPFTQ